MRLRNKALAAEWRNISKNRILLVSIIVMLFIPIMYGGFFLGSVWDPYGNTSHLPVAVVNEDAGATMNGQSLHIGDDLVTELKTNNDMGWQFVSAEQANKGISDGTYYMKLTIPETFSQNATTVTSEHPAKSTIEYTITPARNYIASLLTTQAAKQISQTVSSNVSRAYVDTLFNAIGTLKTGLSDAASGASDLASGSSELSSGVSNYTNGVSAAATGQSSLTTGISRISDGSLKLKNGLTTLSGSLPTASDLTQLKNGVANIQTGITTLNAAVQTPSAELTAQQAAVASDAALLQQKLEAYSLAAANANASIVALQTAIASSQTTAVVNAGDMLSIVSASQSVASQTVSLLGNLSSLTTMLNSQQTTLKANVATLTEGTNALSPKLLVALNGYTSVANGTTALLSGANELSDGSTTALSGSNQLLNGLSTLNAASPSLQNGATKVADGNSKLATALTDASHQLSVQPTGDTTAEQIVSPIVNKETTEGDVPNYGYALSPYVLSLGLFVGALVFNVIYPVRHYFSKPKNAVSWWAAKMSVAYIVATCQALVLVAIMVFGLGLHPDNPGQFVLLSIVTSITYMSIISLLVLALDNVGRFLAMLLLVLQLGSAEGVFPIVLSSPFFQAVNPFVPMTFSIHAYREAISSGLGANVYWQNVGILLAIIVAVNILMIIFFHIHGMRHFRHEAIEA